jgi:hypothetical protein
MRKITKHIYHYTPLVGIFIVGFFGFWLFSYNRQFQIALAAAMSVSYVAWGIIHHKIHKDLYLEVIIEYVLIALLGFVIMLTLLFRA